ncbi:glucokinase [Sphingosinicella sp. CPCC 101087]|uniref:glucokinase n=1 Tax=Sphingosinicella sp. CPCC 101087 TaxID=2497754 RepID=UPI00101BDD04|nr:glucokinase [Sphingosinicella sp. CPCC 101087]
MTQLVCAIDGENVSFALVTDASEGRLDAVRLFRTTDFPTFTDALQTYTRENRLSTAGLPLGLAVAGVTGGDVISLANCRWYISVSGLRAFLAREPLLINDFEAIAWSLADVDTARLTRVGPLPPRAVAPGRRFLVVGTGPGLGMASLIVGESEAVTVMAGEGGHSSFAPQTKEEDALLLQLRARFGHVSFERLLAGVGLQTIHAAIAEAKGRPGAPPAPEAIVTGALRGDPIALEAADLFTAILGSFAGNMALSTSAFDGLFLVSPLLRSMLPLIERGRFRAAFVAKGRMRKALEQVPVSFATDDHARLLGVAAAMRARGFGLGDLRRERPAA